MKEWMVTTTMLNGEECLAVFNSFWRLLFWFLRWGRKCSSIRIRLILPADFEPTEEFPCETCLRWDECNGIDIDNCT